MDAADPVQHVGSRLVFAIGHRTHPRLSPQQREEVLQRLHEEATQAGLVGQPAPPEWVESWMDATEFELDTQPMEPELRAKHQRRLQQLRQAYAADPTVVDQALVHSWRYFATACDSEQDRRVHPDSQRVAVDMDGVVYDCHTTMNTWLQSRGYQPPTTEMTRYDLSGHWGIDGATVWREFQEATRAGLMFRHGDPLMDGVIAVRRLYAAGHKVVIVTARDLPGQEQQCHAATIRWLRDHGIPFDELHLTSKKETVEFDMLLDDAPGNVERVTGHGQRGVVLDRPWNRLEGKGHARRRWTDVVKEMCQTPEQPTLFPVAQPVLSPAAANATIPLGDADARRAGPARTA